MRRETELEKVRMEVAYDVDIVVGQTGAGFKSVESREGIVRHRLALHTGIELEGFERRSGGGSGGVPNGGSP